MSKELDTVADEFALLGKQLDVLNAELQKKKLAPMKVLAREEWDKKQQGD